MYIFIVILAILTCILFVLGYRLLRSFREYKIRRAVTSPLILPSVSVCIPARNETHAMTQCLERVLASDYEKLEILVYDDSSTDDTSVLIRSFAQAGVRFLPGENLPEGWLGKNYALQTLASQASGTYVMFMDVDTYITPTTISKLVDYTMAEGAEMVSVIPGRDDSWRASVLFGHLRYFWQLVMSRSSSPAVSGAFWMISRKTLFDMYGGFGPIKTVVSPDKTFAYLLGQSSYRCLITSDELSVAYEKKWSSQVETTHRLAYPMAGGRLRYGIGVLLILIALNSPPFVILSGFIFGWTTIQVAAAGVMLGYMTLYASYAKRIWKSRWLLGGLLWPYVIFQELILYIQSMLGYLTHTITWKGRPVMVHASAASPQQKSS